MTKPTLQPHGRTEVGAQDSRAPPGSAANAKPAPDSYPLPYHKGVAAVVRGHRGSMAKPEPMFSPQRCECYCFRLLIRIRLGNSLALVSRSCQWGFPHSQLTKPLEIAALWDIPTSISITSLRRTELFWSNSVCFFVSSYMLLAESRHRKRNKATCQPILQVLSAANINLEVA